MKRALTKKMGLKTVYLKNTLEDIVFKRLAGKKERWFAKMKGMDEYRIEIGSELLAETLLEQNEITADEYEKH